MNSHTEPSLRFYRCVYVVGCIGVLLACALGLVHAARVGSWALAVASAVGLSSFAYAVMRRSGELRAHAHIPGPVPSFFIGNLPALMNCGHGGRDLALAALHAEYGPVVRIHLAWGSGPYVSLSYASANIHRRDLDSQRRADRTILPLSLMGIEMNDRHRAHRQAMAPAFSGHGMRDGNRVLREITDTYVTKWRDHGSGTPGDLQEDIHRWSAHSAGVFLFGDAWDTRADLQDYFAALGRIEEDLSFRAFHPFFVRWMFPRRALAVRAAYRCLFTFLEVVLSRRGASGCPHRAAPRATLLDELAKLDGGTWSHRECVEEMMSLVLGGTDAMSYAMCQALVLLARNPSVQAEARRRGAEAQRRGVTTRPDTNVTSAPDMPFIRHVFYETLRLFPPVPFSAKVAREGIVEMDLPIPEGTTIMWAKNVVGRDPAVFQDPGSFRPERFVRGGESAVSMLPFGAGPRHCIGSRLAEEQAAALLTAILENFELDPIEDVAVTFRATVSIVPSSVPVRMTPRQQTGAHVAVSGPLRMARQPDDALRPA